MQRQIRRLLTPGDLPPRATLLAGILAMIAVYALDLLTPPNIRLHVLYVFPLAVIALHCTRMTAILAALALSVVFQFSSLAFQGISTGSLAVDALIAFATSVLTVTLARATRESHLAIAELATTDWLTGLQNRRKFMSLADAEIARQKRYGGVFSLAVIDLDNFKALNDSLGHQAGDTALVLLAKILRKHTRQTDSIARLGGDEFAILMPNTHEHECNSLCQLLSARVAKQMAEVSFAVTASIGRSTFDEAPDSTAGALQAADKAMYAAKARRKNGVGRVVRIPVSRLESPPAPMGARTTQ